MKDITKEIADMRETTKDLEIRWNTEKDILAFSNAMITLIEDKKVRDEYTKQALQWSKKYDWKNSAGKFSHTIHRVLEERLFIKNKFVFIKSS